jgi:hypothetical protein
MSWLDTNAQLEDISSEVQRIQAAAGPSAGIGQTGDGSPDLTLAVLGLRIVRVEKEQPVLFWSVVAGIVLLLVLGLAHVMRGVFA